MSPTRSEAQQSAASLASRRMLVLPGTTGHEFMLDSDDQARILLGQATVTLGSQRMGGALRRDFFLHDPCAIIIEIGLVHSLDSPPGLGP